MACHVLVVSSGEGEQRLERAGIAFERFLAQPEDQRLLGRNALRLPVLAEGDRDLKRPLDVGGEIANALLPSAADCPTPRAETAYAPAGACSRPFCRRRRRQSCPDSSSDLQTASPRLPDPSSGIDWEGLPAREDSPNTELEAAASRSARRPVSASHRLIVAST